MEQPKSNGMKQSRKEWEREVRGDGTGERNMLVYLSFVCLGYM